MVVHQTLLLLWMLLRVLLWVSLEKSLWKSLWKSLGIVLGIFVAWAIWNTAGSAAAADTPDLLSPRLPTGCATPCLIGAVHWGDASVDGQVVVFASSSNMLIPNDTNGSADIFVWQAGNVQRVSIGVAGEQSDDVSDVAAISGNGRYVYFRNFAGNLAPGTRRHHMNLYVKDLATGRLALISRDSDGMPANHLLRDGTYEQIDADFSGRYVVFASSFAGFVAGVLDINYAPDIFLADLDPDANEDYFDTPARFYLLSATPDSNAIGNSASFAPTLRQDASAVVWLTRATNLAPGLESNKATVDVVLAQLGVHEDGSLDPTRRTLQAINRMGDGATTVTPQGAQLARLDPWRDIVAFVTADDIPGTGDNLSGDDVYLSIGNQGNVTDRHLVWISHTQAMTANVSLDTAWDPVLPPINRSQVAWIAHDELRTVDDLRIQRSAPFYPEGWSVINWVEAATPSSEPVSSSGLSADGRYAFWTTTESYQWGEPPTPMNLYRRQIAPPQSVPLTIYAVGGTVSQVPMGTLLANSTLYSTTTLVELTPSPAVGYRFRNWIGVDAQVGMTATVALYTARTVTATFDAMTAPVAADLTLTVPEDTSLQDIILTITDPDPDEAHTVSVALPPDNGTASVHNNLAIYKPAEDFNGIDHFALQVTDAYGLQLATAAQVTVQVTPVNDPPSAAYATGSGENRGAAIPVWVTVDDPDQDDSYTLEVETPPTTGSVKVGSQLQTQEHFEYVPQEGFDGVDSFTFRVTDSDNATIVGTATVTVTLATPRLHLPALRR